MGKALAVLGVATVFIAWMSEILVGAVEPAAHGLGLSNVFVGVFVVAALGNAAEHATAVTVAMKNRMHLSLSIAIGSGVQVALFVAPVLVLVSLFLGPAPMDLIFSGGLVPAHAAGLRRLRDRYLSLGAAVLASGPAGRPAGRARVRLPGRPRG